MASRFRLAISTGGGDAPGLNGVIRAIVLAAVQRGWEVHGIRKGFNGLLGEDVIVPLTADTVRGITHLGGTILGTTNRGNPFKWAVKKADGTTEIVDRSDEVVEAFHKHGFDALIVVGGDGSLGIAHQLSLKGIPIVGVPKTIDNDLAATDVTFGFRTAVQTATEAIDKLHSTAESHERTMVVEVMGRNTGWIALFAGVASTADVILIPEIPYRLENVCAKIRDRYRKGRNFGIVVVAEGAMPQGGEQHFQEKGLITNRLGGIADLLATQIAEQTGVETRSLVLGHLQRGGTPTADDRLISLRFGAAAVRLVAAGHYGTMVALHPPVVRAVPLEEAIAKVKYVPVDGDVVQTARDMGISFGD
jgi:ATP-dependent phosphofructokinase / diphosphate-dependent phosphofructokinase